MYLFQHKTVDVMAHTYIKFSNNWGKLRMNICKWERDTYRRKYKRNNWSRLSKNKRVDKSLRSQIDASYFLGSITLGSNLYGAWCNKHLPEYNVSYNWSHMNKWFDAFPVKMTLLCYKHYRCYSKLNDAVRRGCTCKFETVWCGQFYNAIAINL